MDIWNNLAEAYLKEEQREAAEYEYQKILKITPYHIDSQIGLGETYVAMGDAEVADSYEKAISHFTRAIQMSKSKRSARINRHVCSKKLKKKELAVVLYSLGYARVKLFEKSKLTKDTGLLHLALKNFRECRKHDPENYKAQKAIETIEKKINRFAPQLWIEQTGPLILFVLSAIVFGISQYGFWNERLRPSADINQDSVAVDQSSTAASDANLAEPSQNEAQGPVEQIREVVLEATEKATVTIDSAQYTVLTFGSMTFMVISLYLPQLLTLKIAGIELEKSTVDQIKTTGPLGITK